MPNSKSPIVRIHIIDQLLRESYSKPLTLAQICDEVNERMLGDNEIIDQVSLLTIRADIAMMKREFGVSIEIRRQHHKGALYFYTNPFQSIFHHGLTQDESNDAKDMLSKLRRFIGHEQFRFMIQGERNTSPFNSFLRLVSPKARPINESAWNDNGFVLFDSASATYRGRRNIEGLADAIADEAMVLVTYKQYGKPREVIQFFPFVLKQYNNRWNCLGEDINPEFAEKRKTNPYRNLALDRIEKISRPSAECIVEQQGENPLFKPSRRNPIEDWEKSVFGSVVGSTVPESVVGSTVPEDAWQNPFKLNSPLVIRVAVNPNWLPFEKSRPIHHSFQVVKGKFHLNDWVEAEYRLLPNTEFYNQMAYRAGKIIVLSPEEVVHRAKRIFEEALEAYDSFHHGELMSKTSI